MSNQLPFAGRGPEQWSQINPAFTGNNPEVEKNPALGGSGPDDNKGRLISALLPGKLWRSCKTWLTTCPCTVRNCTEVEPIQIRLCSFDERIRTYDDSVTRLTHILASASREISRRASSKTVAIPSPHNTNTVVHGMSMQSVESRGDHPRPQGAFNVYTNETFMDKDSNTDSVPTVTDGEGIAVPDGDIDYSTASSSSDGAPEARETGPSEQLLQALPDEGLPPGHAPVSQNLGSLTALWMSPEWLHCYALPELQDPLHQEEANGGDDSTGMTWNSNSLLVEEEAEQQAWQLSNAAEQLLRVHLALQESPTSQQQQQQQPQSPLLDEEALRCCLSAAAELAEAVMPLLSPGDAVQAKKLRRKCDSRVQSGYSMGPEIVFPGDFARLLVQVPLVAASQHLIPHLEQEVEAGRVPAPEQPLRDLGSLVKYLEDLCTAPPGPKQVLGNLQSLRRALKAPRQGGVPGSAIDQWRYAVSVWFGSTSLGTEEEAQLDLERAAGMLPALETVLLRLGYGDRGCQRAVGTLREWRTLLKAASPLYIELFTETTGSSTSTDEDPTWASVAPAPPLPRSPVTLMSNATFELDQNPLFSDGHLESGSPWSSTRQAQTGFSGSRLSSINGSPASSVADGDQNNEAEVRRLEALLNSANEALLAMWEQRSGLASENRQLEADLQIVAEEAALAKAMMDQNAAWTRGQSPAASALHLPSGSSHHDAGGGVPAPPPAAATTPPSHSGIGEASDKQVRELEATKKELEQRVSAMATEASCIQSDVQRLLKEVEDRFSGDLNGSSNLASAYQSLLKSVSRPLHREDTASVHCGANKDDGMVAVPIRAPLPPTSQSSIASAADARTVYSHASRSGIKNTSSAAAAAASQPNAPMVPAPPSSASSSHQADEGGSKYKFAVKTSGVLRTGGSGARYTSSATSSSGIRRPLLYRISEPSTLSSSSTTAADARRSEGGETVPWVTTRGQNNGSCGIALAVDPAAPTSTSMTETTNAPITAADRMPSLDEPNTPDPNTPDHSSKF